MVLKNEKQLLVFVLYEFQNKPVIELSKEAT